MQVLRLGNVVPDFKAETTMGPMHWHEWIKDSWAILFSHPADFTVSRLTTRALYMPHAWNRQKSTCTFLAQLPRP